MLGFGLGLGSQFETRLVYGTLIFWLVLLVRFILGGEGGGTDM